VVATPEPAGIVTPAVQTTSLSAPAPQMMPVSTASASADAPAPAVMVQPSAASATTAIVPSEAVVPAKGFYLQFGAYAQAANAEALRARLSQDAGTLLPSLTVESSNNLYRLYSGPFASREAAAAAAAQAERDGVKPFIVQR